MLRRYTFWLVAAVLFQFVTAALHALSFIARPPLRNDTERQIQELVTTYRENMGAGFHPSFWDLYTAMSACFLLLCLLGGLTLGYLLLKNAGAELMRGAVVIHLIIFGVTFIIMLIFTFLPPIVMTGLIFVNLLVGFLTMPKASGAQS